MISWRGLLVAITFDLISAQSTLDCAIKGVSYTDPNIQTLNGGQPQDAMTCQKACAFTASCHYFTYYTDSKGCWLMTDQAKLNEKGDVPSEAFAVSGAKVCPPLPAVTLQQKTNATIASIPQEELHPDAEGHVTVAPGVEIGPNGPRPVILGSSMNVTVTVTNASTESSGWDVPYIGVKVPELILGLHWSWWCLIIAAACLLCCCLGWCLCCGTSRPRKKRALEAQVMKPTEEEPLVPQRPVKDAGLFRPQLHVPELPMPHLVTPQLVSLPASQAQANARAMELHISPIMSPRSSPAGSPTHFVRQMV